MNESRLRYYLINVKYIKQDIIEKNKTLREAESPEEKSRIKSEIDKCYAEIKKEVVRLEDEQKKFLEAEAEAEGKTEEQPVESLSENQLRTQARHLNDRIRMVKAFQKIVNTPTVLKNIRRRS